MFDTTPIKMKKQTYIQPKITVVEIKGETDILLSSTIEYGIEPNGANNGYGEDNY